MMEDAQHDDPVAQNLIEYAMFSVCQFPQAGPQRIHRLPYFWVFAEQREGVFEAKEIIVGSSLAVSFETVFE